MLTIVSFGRLNSLELIVDKMKTKIAGNKSLEKYAEDGAPQLRTGELRTGK